MIRKILKHMNLWDVKRKPPPRAHAPPIYDFPAYDEHPEPSGDDYIRDPDYPAEALRVILPMKHHTLETLIEQIIWIQERNHRAYLSHRRGRIRKLFK